MEVPGSCSGLWIRYRAGAIRTRHVWKPEDHRDDAEELFFQAIRFRANWLSRKDQI